MKINHAVMSTGLLLGLTKITERSIAVLNYYLMLSLFVTTKAYNYVRINEEHINIVVAPTLYVTRSTD